MLEKEDGRTRQHCLRAGTAALVVVIALVAGAAIVGADTGTASQPAVEDYADDETGSVETEGLRDAIDDWRSGEIETTLLREVIDYWRSGDPVEPVGDLEIHHLDVGQADSTLIVTPEGETILIDTGDWRQDGSEVIAYLEDQDIDRIDHLVATHGHADHIGGHEAVIEHFEENGDGIGAAYDSGVAHTSATYERYLDAIEEYDVDLFVVEEGDELPIENEDLDGLVLNPPKGDSGSDLHHNSLAIAFEYGDFRYLTTGDAEEAAEQRMVDEWSSELAATVYQAGHHGSSTSSTSEFMDAVDPETAIISSDYDSQYGHPHDEVLLRFDELGIETYWTGVHGDIVLTTDGQTVSVKTEHKFSTHPKDLLEEKPTDDDAASMAPLPRDAVAPSAPA